MKTSRTRALVGLASVFCLALAQGAAAEPSVSAHLDFGDAGQTADFGAPFTLVIEARHNASEVARLPDPLSLGEDFVERVQARQHQRVKEGEAVIDRYRLELLPFATGDLSLPQIPVAIGDQNLKTEPLGVFVNSSLSEQEAAQVDAGTPAAMAALEKLAAPDPQPLSITVNNPTAALIGVIIFLLAMFAMYMSRLLKRRAALRVPEPPAPAKQPRSYELAREALDYLKDANYIERELYKPFYAELSMILRRYIGQRYRFDSLDLTVDELKETLACLRTPGLDEAGLSQTLQLADLVKFAKFTPNQTVATESLEFAYRLVRDTGPQPEPPKKSEENKA